MRFEISGQRNPQDAWNKILDKEITARDHLLLVALLDKELQDIHVPHELQELFEKIYRAHIRKEYDRLRRLVVRVLREIEALRSADDQARHTLSLDRLKLEIEEKLDKIGNGLDTLIREDLIDVQMATSMMNDISYTREICWDLVDAGSVLFSEMGLAVRLQAIAEIAAATLLASRARANAG